MSISDRNTVATVDEMDNIQRPYPYFAHSTRLGKSDFSSASVANHAKHSTATMLLHWGTLLAIILGVGVILVREYIEDNAYRILLLELHRQLGILVLFFTFVRLPIRYFSSLSRVAVRASTVFSFCAGICHLMLYVLLIGLPVLGWAATNAHNVELNLFGVYELPKLCTDDPDLADELSDYHLWASWALLVVLVFHIAGAMVHQFIFKDKVLHAMIPGRQG